VNLKKYAILLAIIFCAAFLPYLGFFNHVDPYEVGISWNRVTGELWLQGSGIHFTPPWVAVSRVDTRPMRVCVTTSGRGYNCKLIQFVPEAYKEFVAVEGHRYYWWANRFSFNSGYDDEYRGIKDLLRGHAYGTTRYSFMKILEEYREPGSP
jgi:hypothetical protein